MSKGIYIGIDGVAKKVPKMYVGVETDIPIYETITTTNTYDFTYANRAYFFSDNASTATTGWTISSYSSGGTKLIPNNFGVDSSTATITLTVLKDLTNVTVKGMYFTESNFDKITLIAGGTTALNAASGTVSSLTTFYTGNLTTGQTIQFTYVKDTSQHATNESSTYFTIDCNDITVTTTSQELVGYETKEVARKIKKGYIGVSGVAKLFFFGEEAVQYTGNFTITDVTIGNSPYKLYTLTSSGTLTLEENAEYWMCAAGNSGSNDGSAGSGHVQGQYGGGGGLTTSGSLGAGSYLVTIGAGGSQYGGSTILGSNSIANLTSNGPQNGASGGGGSVLILKDGSSSNVYANPGGNGQDVSTVPFSNRITSGFANYPHSAGGGGGFVSLVIDSNPYFGSGGDGGTNGSDGVSGRNQIFIDHISSEYLSAGGHYGGGRYSENATFYGGGGGGGFVSYSSNSIIAASGLGYQGVVYLLLPSA